VADERSEVVARAAQSAPLPPDPHALPDPGAWFARDAERHYLDRPRFCPMCAASLVDGAGLTTEYWTSDVRVFMTWCGSCGWFGEVVRFDRVTITEEEH
jgi:hypothetical protein